MTTRATRVATPDPVSLEVRDLTLSFGGLKALSGVTLSVDATAPVGLIGPNGAGKSTLVNCVTGHYRSDSGAVELDGIDISSQRPRRRVGRGVSRTFQNLLLFETQSAMENVLFGGYLDWRRAGLLRSTPASGTLQNRARDLLDSVGLGDSLDVIVSDLPYADRKRVELARALMASPRLLILDEPTAGLGEHDRREFMTNLDDARRRLGFAVLMVAHDMDVIFTFCRQVYVLDHGVLVAEGTPDEIRHNKLVQDIYLGGEE